MRFALCLVAAPWVVSIVGATAEATLLVAAWYVGGALGQAIAGVLHQEAATRPESEGEEEQPDKAPPDLDNLTPKIKDQMGTRGWTREQIEQAVQDGEATPATDRTTKPWSRATRYVHPETGRSVTVNDETGKVIQVGGDGFKY
jgi:uncharacterized iron-regulated membrane protein